MSFSLGKPGLLWRTMRRVIQLVAVGAILLGPFMGGWQRLERNDLSSWNSPDTELPNSLREDLPRGDTARLAYDYGFLRGGGTAAALAGIPFSDPVSGVFVLMSGTGNQRALTAFALSIFIALVGGRLFCGWFCPFGMLSRLVASLHSFLPLPPRKAIPRRRPVRYLILLVSLFAGMLGAHVVLYMMLPHLLVQQTLYSSWLLGGGGAALGLLIGLLVAGLWLGPTTYCATLCPTGAALALAGRVRLLHLSIKEPDACGACHLCSQACWLQLQPSTGDPGPDCDICARCVPICPRANLEIVVAPPSVKNKRRRSLPVILGVFLVLMATPRSGSAQRESPELVLATERVFADVTVAIDIVDRTGIPTAADSDEILWGDDVSMFLARGGIGEVDDHGLIDSRETYDGPLRVVFIRGSEVRGEMVFERATSPLSTQGRSIYRRHLHDRLHPGDIVEIQPIEGWLSEPARFELPTPGVDTSPKNVLLFILGGLLLYGGLLSLALAIPPRTQKS